MLFRPLIRWTIRGPVVIKLVFFLSSALMSAQLPDSNPNSIALGGCYTVVSESIPGAMNEARLGIRRERAVYTIHARPFSPGELGISSLTICTPLFPGQMCISGRQLGIPGYRLSEISFAYGMKISDHLFAGLGFNFYNTGTKYSWSFLRALGVSGGILVRPQQNTLIGLHLMNPVTLNNYAEYGNIFPARLSLGIKQQIYEENHIYAEISTTNYRKLRLKMGVDFRLLEKLVLKAGYHSLPATPSAGAGIELKRIRIDLAWAYSLKIGFIPAVGLKYSFQR